MGVGQRTNNFGFFLRKQGMKEPRGPTHRVTDKRTCEAASFDWEVREEKPASCRGKRSMTFCKDDSPGSNHKGVRSEIKGERRGDRIPREKMGGHRVREKPIGRRTFFEELERKKFPRISSMRPSQA